MKYIKFLFLPIVGLIISCNDTNRDNSTTNSAGSMAADSISNRNRFDEEVSQLQSRINQRIQELNAEIDEARREREAEKNEKKWRNYDDRIANRELRRKNFQDRLDRLKTQTQEGWQEFKSDVEDVFERDRTDTVQTNGY